MITAATKSIFKGNEDGAKEEFVVPIFVPRQILHILNIKLHYHITTVICFALILSHKLSIIFLAFFVCLNCFQQLNSEWLNVCLIRSSQISFIWYDRSNHVLDIFSFAMIVARKRTSLQQISRQIERSK